MSAPNLWYDEDAFWHLFEPVLFSPQRIARAREEVDSLTRLLPIGSAVSVLDLCCGIGRLLLLSEKRVTQNWSSVETRWIAIRGTERAEYRVAIRSYSAVELSSLLVQCGFTELQVYGSLDGIEYNQHAQRLVVVGRKPGAA